MLPFSKFPNLPLTGLFRKSLDTSLPRFDLSLELCLHCGLVRQMTCSSQREYIEITRSTALQFPAYVHELIDEIKTAGIGPDDLILEVGANDGLFMSALRDAGFNYIVGVEPSQKLAAVAQNKGFNIVCDYFGPDLVPFLLSKYGRARAVICRHTLEHVPYPDAFVAALAECMDVDALALLEVPDGSAIPDLLNVYEFWDEHLFYFSQNNLIRLLQRAGFEVLETALRPNLETRNLLAWCKKLDLVQVNGFGSDDAQCVALWQSLPTRWSAFKLGFVAALLHMPRPLFVIGASHSQTNLVNYTEVGQYIDFFIDDDPAKSGFYAPVFDTRNTIITSKQFESFPLGGTLLKTGFGYEKWTKKLCALAVARGMSVLDHKYFI